MLGLYSMLECNLCCEILLLLDRPNDGRYGLSINVVDCGESNTECCVHLVGVDRVMYS